MVKIQTAQQQPSQSSPPIRKQAKNSKYNRFAKTSNTDTVDPNKKSTWPTNAVVYIGHLPHGFYQDQLCAYFTQYGQVLGVKVARSRKTARSKGYAFIQFKYPQVAEIVAQTMNGYMLMGKVLVANVLQTHHKNPFTFSTSKQFKFVNWKRIFMHQKNRVKTSEELHKQVSGLIKNQKQRKLKLKTHGIAYQYPGFMARVARK